MCSFILDPNCENPINSAKALETKTQMFIFKVEKSIIKIKIKNVLPRNRVNGPQRLLTFITQQRRNGYWKIIAS